jgi:hypothetical protein
MANQPKNKKDDMLAICEILQSIAESYPTRSRGRKALRTAADAFVFVTTHKRLATSYAAFRRASARSLTREQELTLKRMGIKP